MVQLGLEYIRIKIVVHCSSPVLRRFQSQSWPILWTNPENVPSYPWKQCAWIPGKQGVSYTNCLYLAKLHQCHVWTASKTMAQRWDLWWFETTKARRHRHHHHYCISLSWKHLETHQWELGLLRLWKKKHIPLASFSHDWVNFARSSNIYRYSSGSSNC